MRKPKTAEPKTVTLTVSKEQIAGLKQRKQQVALASLHLSNYVAGIAEGHGHVGAQPIEFDDEALTLTIALP